MIKKIPYQQEAELNIEYKGNILNKKYKADFLCFNSITVEIKAVQELTDIHYSQVINYL